MEGPVAEFRAAQSEQAKLEMEGRENAKDFNQQREGKERRTAKDFSQSPLALAMLQRRRITSKDVESLMRDSGIDTRAGGQRPAEVLKDLKKDMKEDIEKTMRETGATKRKQHECTKSNSSSGSGRGKGSNRRWSASSNSQRRSRPARSIRIKSLSNSYKSYGESEQPLTIVPASLWRVDQREVPNERRRIESWRLSFRCRGALRFEMSMPDFNCSPLDERQKEAMTAELYRVGGPDVLHKQWDDILNAISLVTQNVASKKEARDRAIQYHLERQDLLALDAAARENALIVIRAMINQAIEAFAPGRELPECESFWGKRRAARQ